VDALDQLAICTVVIPRDHSGPDRIATQIPAFEGQTGDSFVTSTADNPAGAAVEAPVDVGHYLWAPRLLAALGPAVSVPLGSAGR